ncbi:MAG: DUF4783 domain-containing protein [Crocinitomix sp.]|nr:DUF4783 domain-containing protein [Crocinitomix sp.]
MKKIVAILLLLVGSGAFAQPTSGDIIMVELDSADTLMAFAAPVPSLEAVIISAFKTGDATAIATYFGDNVDLSILGKANLYSKSQAEQVLQHFYTDHKPKAFSIMHKGTAKSSKYFIGELISIADKKYRVTINSKLEGGKNSITSLTIEAN